MQIARVLGHIVSTVKSGDYDNYKMLIVQPVDPDGNKADKSFLAVDAVQAGPGDLVLVIDEGGSANVILGRTDVNAIRAVVTGIVDEIDMRE
jgi:ethanolamine utilization protein EutN